MIPIPHVIASFFLGKDQTELPIYGLPKERNTESYLSFCRKEMNHLPSNLIVSLFSSHDIIIRLKYLLSEYFITIMRILEKGRQLMWQMYLCPKEIRRAKCPIFRLLSNVWHTVSESRWILCVWCKFLLEILGWKLRLNRLCCGLGVRYIFVGRKRKKDCSSNNEREREDISPGS